MAFVTMRVLDGADRGRVFEQVPTPVTIGREEGNSIQLNDERVSRFHLKIQEDQNKLVLTDLQSTNGTKVNGESLQVWILRPGDVICLGRSVLLMGSEEEIAVRLAKLRGVDLAAGVLLEDEDLERATTSVSLDSELFWGNNADDRATLHTLLPPELPQTLSAGQAAELSELLQYVYLRLRGLIQSVRIPPRSEQVILEQRQWQNVLDLQLRLANYLREIGEPET
ncbi:MAG: FHA domain-containing protein [Thermoguttaceae bacterium]